MTDRVTILLMAFRACLLAAVDAIEEFLEMPRTKDMRKDYRRQ